MIKVPTNQTRLFGYRIAKALASLCLILCWTQPSLAQLATESGDVDDNQPFEIALSLKNGTKSTEVLELLTKLADQRTEKTVIQFVSGATQESIAQINAPKTSSAKSVTALIAFFRENGISKISVGAQVIGPSTDAFKDLQNVSIRFIARDDSGEGPQLITKMFNPPPPAFVELHKRGIKPSASIAKSDEIDNNLILLFVEGSFQLHPYIEAVNLIERKPFIGNYDVIALFPFVDMGADGTKIPARILNQIGQRNATPSRGRPMTGTPIGLPGPPHLPLGSPGPLTSPGPGVDPFSKPMAAESNPSPKSKSFEQSRLAREASLADKKSQTKAEELRSAGNTDSDPTNVRKILGPLVVKAFDAKQSLYQAELDSLSQRVSRLKALVTERQKAKDQIIGRRIDDLLNPDLKWDATAAAASKSSSNPTRPISPVTSTRTDHFFVSSDPFAADAVAAAVLEDLAKVAELAYRGLTRQWFNKEPIDFEKKCGVDASIAESWSSAQGTTTYSLTPDGKITGAMIHLQGPQAGLQRRLGHEVMHLVLAANFSANLPRWIDEGIAMLEGSDADFQKAQEAVVQAKADQTLIPLHELFAMSSYPSDKLNRQLMYSQSRLLVEWLVQRGGKRRLVECMRSVQPDKRWIQLPDSIVSAYGFKNVADMEAKWIASIDTMQSLESLTSGDPFGE